MALDFFCIVKRKLLLLSFLACYVTDKACRGNHIILQGISFAQYFGEKKKIHDFFAAGKLRKGGKMRIIRKGKHPNFQDEKETKRLNKCALLDLFELGKGIFTANYVLNIFFPLKRFYAK